MEYCKEMRIRKREKVRKEMSLHTPRGIIIYSNNIIIYVKKIKYKRNMIKSGCIFLKIRRVK